jgi:hypothetical protein
MKPWKLIVPRLVIACLFGAAITALALLVGRNNVRYSIVGQNQAITRYSLRQINTAIVAFRLKYHTLPRSLNQLKTTGGDWYYNPQTTDFWGRPFVYTVQGTHYLVISYGRDGKPGGMGWDTDLTSDNPYPPNTGPTFHQFLTDPTTQDMVQWAYISGVLAGLLCWFTVRPKTFSWRSALGLATQILLTLAAAAFIALMITLLHFPSGH